MRGLDPEMVHQPESIAAHVATAGTGRDRGGRRIMSMRLGIPAASIIVEWPMSRLSKRITRKPRSAIIAQKLLVPAEHLRRQPHHHQDRLAAGVTHLLVGDLDPVRGRQTLLAQAGHQTMVAHRNRWPSG